MKLSMAILMISIYFASFLLLIKEGRDGFIAIIKENLP